MSKDKKVNTTPEKPENPFFLWAGIILAGSGSLFFNHSHDTHSLGNNYLAVIAGILPPVLAAIVPHAIKHVDDGWMPYAVFAGSIGAMIVSAKGTAVVLTPAYGALIAWAYSLVLDAIALVCLYALTIHYQKVHEYKRWLAGNRPPAPVRAPAPVRPSAAPVPSQGPGPVPVQPSAPVTGTGAGGRAPGHARDAKPTVTRDAELCKGVAQEMAARERPAIEDTLQKIARAEGYVREFRQRTGVRMNADELAIALRTHKSKIPAIRAAINEGEDPIQAGERADDKNHDEKTG